MKLANLELFEEVYRRGSFSGAARARDVSTSVVSRAIAGLEAELGTLLFYRTTRRIAPTEAGALLLRQIEQHLEALRGLPATLADSTDVPNGVLRVSASHSFGIQCLSRLVPSFCAEYPRVRVELILTDQVVDIVGERFDLALRHGPLADSSMIATPILRTRYHVCANASYLTAKGKPSRPADIADRECLTFPLTGFADVWRFQDPNGDVAEVPIRSTMSANSGIVLRECAAMGQGIVLLSDWLISADLASGRLIDLFPDYVATPSDFQTAISAVYPNRKYTPKKVTAFVGFLRRELAIAGAKELSAP